MSLGLGSSVQCLLGVARHLGVANLGFLTHRVVASEYETSHMVARVSTGLTWEQATKRRSCLLHESLVAVAD